MDFESLDPPARRASALLLGTITGRLRSLDVETLGSDHVLALDFAYSQVRVILGDLFEQLGGSYPDQ